MLKVNIADKTEYLSQKQFLSLIGCHFMHGCAVNIYLKSLLAVGKCTQKKHAIIK